MGEAAVKAAKAVGYVGAGTVEFVASPLPDAFRHRIGSPQLSPPLPVVPPSAFPPSLLSPLSLLSFL